MKKGFLRLSFFHLVGICVITLCDNDVKLSKKSQQILINRNLLDL